jgi:exonuclease SbcD
MIRILHTSDWHLGLELGGHDRLEEQERFLDWLLTTVRDRNVNALLVCGDLYDTANPSVAAQRLFGEFLVRFHRECPDCSLVCIAGNHDSASRLELPRPFGLALGGIHLKGQVTEAPLDHLIGLRDGNGDLAAWCVALPFLRASDLDCRMLEGQTPQDAFQKAVGRKYREVREAIPVESRHLPVVNIGHLTLAGSDRAGSERILIGGVESVPVSALLEDAAYVALGHIHRPQKVGAESVRYCGSPYPVAFDEHRYEHSVLVVELAQGHPAGVEVVPVPEFVPFLTFCDPPRPWDAVERAIADFDWSAWNKVPRGLQPLVELRYDASIPVSDLRKRCEDLCRNKPFRLVAAPRSAITGPVAHAAALPPVHLEDREAPEALLERHWRGKYANPVPAAVLDCFHEALTDVAIGSVTP